MFSDLERSVCRMVNRQVGFLHVLVVTCILSAVVNYCENWSHSSVMILISIFDRWRLLLGLKQILFAAVTPLLFLLSLYFPTCAVSSNVSDSTRIQRRSHVSLMVFTHHASILIIYFADNLHVYSYTHFSNNLLLFNPKSSPQVLNSSSSDFPFGSQVSCISWAVG